MAMELTSGCIYENSVQKTRKEPDGKVVKNSHFCLLLLSVGILSVTVVASISIIIWSESLFNEIIGIIFTLCKMSF
ncbi:hypothetical protein AMECASPLE_038074 [Ameca splendens]|uniref:Uncharacterized protein n=1 Tax=Ameca splendens TaxID=208324 RepID=A0ABV0XWZ0_9TELE